MFGLSFLEILVVLFVTFMIFGPEKFPEMLKKAFVFIKEAKRYVADAQHNIQNIATDIEKEVNPLKWDDNKVVKDFKESIDAIPKQLSLEGDEANSNVKKFEGLHPAQMPRDTTANTDSASLYYDDASEVDAKIESYSKKPIDLLAMEMEDQRDDSFSKTPIAKEDLN